MTDNAPMNSSELLTQFVKTYNLEQDEISQLIEELEQANTRCFSLSQDNEKLTLKVQEQSEDLAKASIAIADAEKLAKAAINQKLELDRTKAQLKNLQKENSDLKALNPDKLKAQIKRVKEKSEEKAKTVTRLKQELSQANFKIKQIEQDKQTCKNLVESLRIELDNTKAQGLYHNGDHHLVIWPQKATMLRPDGSEFEGTNLLYLHQSGRGAFITFDPITGESSLCPSPKGGLKPSTKTLEFAHNWLFNVNQIQGGQIKDDDRTPINYND